MYWSSVIGLSIIVAAIIRVGVQSLLPKLPLNLRDLILTLGFAVVFSYVVNLINKVMLPPAIYVGISQLETFAFAFAIAALSNLFRRMLLFGKVTSAVAAVPARIRPRLLDRIGAPAGAWVLRMTVEDHYVIVHLDDGTQHRILMRFADAVADMAGQDGFCTHRSHWVAQRAVGKVERENGRETVLLHDGTSVPVSRNHRCNLEERGFH